MKVLISIGSMQGCKFTRLFKIIDELCDENILDGSQVIAQCGFDRYISKFYQTFDMIADDEFKKLIEQSDLIICHAGTGTVTSCLKMKKKVILFPRLVRYNEHYDDHQLDLCEIFVDAGYVMCAKNKEELKVCIKQINEFKPTPFTSQNAYINELIINYIETGKCSR